MLVNMAPLLQTTSITHRVLINVYKLQEACTCTCIILTLALCVPENKMAGDQLCTYAYMYGSRMRTWKGDGLCKT